MDNWLVNPTGKANSWVEVDLLQEHLNYWIKAIYRARGSNASWEWLAMIAPCVHILRELAKQVHATFGSRQGNKHTSPDLQRDIDRLMASLAQHNVYKVEEGRCIDSEDGEVPNVVTDGIKDLQEPLRDYNKLFRELQAGIRSKPLVGEPYIPPSAAAPSPEGPTSSSTLAGDTDELNGLLEDNGAVDPADDDDAPNADLDDDADTASAASGSEAPFGHRLDDDEPRERWFSLDNEEDVALDMDTFQDDEDSEDGDDGDDDEDN